MGLISSMFESVATVQRPLIGRDSAAGVTQDPFTTLARNLPCSCQQAKASVRDLYAQRNLVVTTTIYFNTDPGAEANDRIIVTDRTGTCSSYNVSGKSQPVGRGWLFKVDAELVRSPV
jgi:hypothetical protein